MSRDPRVDEYIEKAAPFARPILAHLRKLVHEASPGITETIKWNFPHFDYKGILCSMAAFKQHVNFGFWKGKILKDSKELLTPVGATQMATFDKITSMKDLPADKVLSAYIMEAMRLNQEGVRLPAGERKPGKPELPIPEELSSALKRNEKAKVVFENFSPSHRREYIQWITEAKTDATREKRIDATIEMLTDGKSRHWKHQK